MKTPEQISRDILSPTIEDDGTVGRVNHSLIYRWVERAIEVDRAQRHPFSDDPGSEPVSPLAAFSTPQEQTPYSDSVMSAPQEGDVRERLMRIIREAAEEYFREDIPEDGRGESDTIADAILTAFPALGRDIAGEIEVEEASTYPRNRLTENYRRGLARAAEIARNGR